MKPSLSTASALLFSAAALAPMAAAEPCDLTKLRPILANPAVAKCTEDSGYSFVPPTRPSDEALAKICKSSACGQVVQAVAGLGLPDCEIGAVSLKNDILGRIASGCASVSPSSSPSSSPSPTPSTSGSGTVTPTPSPSSNSTTTVTPSPSPTNSTSPSPSPSPSANSTTAPNATMTPQPTEAVITEPPASSSSGSADFSIQGAGSTAFDDGTALTPTPTKVKPRPTQASEGGVVTPLVTTMVATVVALGAVVFV